MKDETKIRETLPIHSVENNKSCRSSVLRVDGLVSKPLELVLEDLQRLPQHNLTDDFTCLEGWSVPKIKWSGVLLESVIALAGPSADAHYIQASAGEFSLPLPRESAQQALLAIRLHGDAMPAVHGGPIRLVVPGGECFTSVKWLNHLELRAEAGLNTAKRIAMGRLSFGKPVR